jgi:carboxypeptidase C (cathepsin A)
VFAIEESFERIAGRPHFTIFSYEERPATPAHPETSMIVAFRLLVVSLSLGLAVSAYAADESPQAPPVNAASRASSKPTEEAKPTADAPRRLPADATSKQTLTLSDRTLNFKASVNVIRLSDEKGTPETDVVAAAYQLDGADPLKRPVTFVFNGGPGAGSAWLQLGAVGPWRLPMYGLAPSAPPILVNNEETWLDFTDLVFIDPPGTGYSRVLGQGEDLRKRLWSVNGDIEALSTVVRRWLADHDRLTSPKFILGESYGGFRAPRLAEELATRQGVGISGLILVSPALDFNYSELRSLVGRLPSYAAAFRERSGKVARADLADVEQYAAHDYLLDLLRGPNDKAAVERVVQRVAALTGLDPALVRELGGRISKDAFLREFNRAQGRVSAFYDTSVSAFDPSPTDYQDRWLDPMLEGFAAPFASAAMDLYNRKLNWRTDETYEMLNETVARNWSWGSSLSPPESIGALQKMLAADPKFKVLISHGLTDVQTPYFGTQLILDQIPNYGGANQLSLKVYPGGHMHYSRDETRKAWREDARRLIEGN